MKNKRKEISSRERNNGSLEGSTRPRNVTRHCGCAHKTVKDYPSARTHARRRSIVPTALTYPAVCGEFLHAYAAAETRLRMRASVLSVWIFFPRRGIISMILLFPARSPTNYSTRAGRSSLPHAAGTNFDFSTRRGTSSMILLLPSRTLLDLSTRAG